MKIKPCGHYVLIKPKKAVETDEMMQIAKRLGMELTGNQMQREDAAATNGIIVAVGFQAWKAYEKDGNGKPWAKIGDEVKFKRHVQDLMFDWDDLDKEGKPQEYFLMVDENVLAVIGD